MKLFLAILAGAILNLPSASAYDSRLGVDPAQDLSALTSSGEIKLTVSRQDKKVSIDVSAVLRVDLQKLYGVVIDFDRYPAYGVPDLKEIHVLERGPGDLLYQWQDLTAAGQDSKQYVEVRLAPVLADSSARATEWQMIPRRSGWPYEDRSQFSALEGSWYMQPLPDGTVYARYYQTATIGLGLPGWLIELIIRNTLVNDTKKVIQALARAAAR